MEAAPGARAAGRHSVHHPPATEPVRHRSPHQVATRGAGAAPRRLPPRRLAEPGRAVRVPVPRRVRRARRHHGPELPGARHEGAGLHRDDMDPGRPLLRVLRHGEADGAAPGPGNQAGPLLQGQVRLRYGAHGEPRVGEDVELVAQGRRRAADPGPLRRQDAQRRAVGDAVPAPAGALQPPVLRVLVRERDRGEGEACGLDQGAAPGDGAVCEQEPQGRLRELQGPGPRCQR